MLEIIERSIAPEIKRLATTYKSIMLIGPRQCGKTTLLRTLFPDYSYVNLEDYNARLLATSDPKGFLSYHKAPLIIDEIQRVPELLSSVQVLLDSSDKMGQYLFTGSYQVSVKHTVSQSLAGRSAIVELLPLSLSELAKHSIVLSRDEQILKGFMPYLYSYAGVVPHEYYESYTQTYLMRDILDIARLNNQLKFNDFLHLLSGRVGQLINYSSLANDLGISSTTIQNWVSILEACKIIYVLRPWNPNRTSQIVKTSRIYFVDTGLLCSLLNITTEEQFIRDPLRGHIFENFVIIEALKNKLNSYKRPNLYFYRDTKGIEIDLIEETSRNMLDLYEIKSSESMNVEFGKNIKRFESKYGDVVRGKAIIYSGQTFKSDSSISYYSYKDIPIL